MEENLDRILIAEDDPVANRMLVRILEKLGFEVTATVNGAEAFETLIQRSDINILITDWMMPEMTGVELCRELRKLERSDYLYIIILTSQAEENMVIEALDSGADDFMAKPANVELIRARLQVARRIIHLQHELQTRKQAMESDLVAAAEIQKSLLPENFVPPPGVNVAWRYKPCSFVAGDIFNIFELDDDHWAFYSVDVSGHGLPSAMLSVTLFRLLAPDFAAESLYLSSNGGIIDPGQVLFDFTGKVTFLNEEAQFFCMLYGVLKLSTREITWCRMGHPPPVRVGADSSTDLLESTGGPPMGMINLPRKMFQVESITLRPGDKFVFFSDGIYESFSPDQRIYSIPRLCDTLQRFAHQPIDQSLESLLADVDDWMGPGAESHDDITIFGIEMASED